MKTTIYVLDPRAKDIFFILCSQNSKSGLQLVGVYPRGVIFYYIIYYKFYYRLPCKVVTIYSTKHVDDKLVYTVWYTISAGRRYDIDGY